MVQKNNNEIQKRYQAQHVKKVTILMHKDNDADCIEIWNGLENKRQWFLDALRKYGRK